MDYEKLDDILDFLRRSQGYAGWASYTQDVARRQNVHFDTINNSTSYAGWCNTLLHFGLVDYKFDANLLHTYIINPKGLDLLNNEKSTLDVHQEYINKEILEGAILKQTNQSFKLNNIQFIITAILTLGTLGSLIIQWKTFEMEKDKTKLEIRDLQYRLDSIQKPNNFKIDNKNIKND
ncbi:hypothetical protein U0038_17585 [Sphingobacterium spiritivorum]|uniref:Uncharacterized protein n=1 Tax=Sphingobacterium spiritivorum ATCC 33861 TaxID=525373 RepID=D7VN43_SPHSI|nr:hypothetical protein [Sphingobacterium spiritivorum]EFK57340.1 hypothetical protein HMPREF0766_12413 [Sphingobacterium spiritivorum ATCC 33861]QQT36580.1 hypothetical protein I6J01_03875 [Sphingobacterium spiritivorum]WQD33331.1 hypothetical protein U0038_17585 [Sphingobacterium spiritivorum]SUJ22114.1 Uncharacterised protein [Sphingobacterium spiritivorum]